MIWSLYHPSIYSSVKQAEKEISKRHCSPLGKSTLYDKKLPTPVLASEIKYYSGLFMSDKNIYPKGYCEH